jgi:cytochrome c oxidase subunit 4
MSEHLKTAPGHSTDHPGYGTFVAVWAVLLILTGLLAVLGLLTITPLKAALVFYYFMHLKYEGPLLKAVVFVTLGTLLIFFALLFSDVAFR